MKSIVSLQIREKDILTKDEDKFNYQHLAKHLFEYIIQQDFPISIGIFGKWGSGKSTLVNFLKQFSQTKGIPVVIYDAVKYRDFSSSRLIEKIKRDNLGNFYLYIAPSIVALAIFLTLLVGFNVSSVWSFLPSAVVFSLIKVSYNKFPDFINKKFFKSMFCKSGIVIIDNIDRLLPSQAIAFLEQLKSSLLKDEMLLSKKNAYVIPCDFEILQEEIRSLYKNKHLDSADYLNKLIEVPFYLPSIDMHTSEFASSLLNESIPTEQKHKIAKIFCEKSVYFDTPRDIKNYLHELDMICLIAASRGKSEQYITDNLAKILLLQIIRSKFSRLLDFLRLHKDALNNRDLGLGVLEFKHEFYKSFVSPHSGMSRSAFSQLDPAFGDSNIADKFSWAQNQLRDLEILSKDEELNKWFLSASFDSLVDLIDSASQSYPSRGGGMYGRSRYGSSKYGG